MSRTLYGLTSFRLVSRRSLVPPLSVRCVEFACAAFETVSAYGTVGLSLGIPTVRRLRIPGLFRLSNSP